MLKIVLYELSRGLAFRRVRHPNAHLYVTVIPLILAILILAFFVLLPAKPSLLGKDGLLSASLGVISTLPGFYFAGLAAVATFTNNEIDKEMPKPAPQISILVQGKWIINPLTRRQFLCYQFAYLVVLSLLLCASLLTANVLTPTIELLKPIFLCLGHGSLIWAMMRVIVLTPLTLLLTSLIAVTLQGIFFLTERIHQP